MSKDNLKYAICMHKITREYHVFPTTIKEDGKCFFSGDLSLCTTMSIDYRGACIASCVTAGVVLKKAVEIGDRICDNCMKLI